MRIPFLHLNAFTTRLEGGNGAGVCPLERWLPARVMQRIATERGLAETAFFVPDRRGDFKLRWFSPAVEIDLCGHATLASAHVVFAYLGFRKRAVTFHSRSGPLTVFRDGRRLTLDFPSLPGKPYAPPKLLARALGKRPREVLRAMDVLCVYDKESDVRALEPDFAMLARVNARGVIATARGRKVDFVSRFFGPRVGIPEDPATGSAHCTLIPYWSRRLRRTKLTAYQASPRGAEFWCEDLGARVHISGHVREVLVGTLLL
jgi:predicted PhzF superfamily epimerase YddE/YHI9